MIVQAGEYTFYEAYLTFHFKRDNAYAPWETIGCALTYGSFADARYVPEYAHLRDEFKREAKEAGDLASTYDFMDNWHRLHQNNNDVVSKVIKYCTNWHDMWGILRRIAVNYVGVRDLNKFAMISVMLKSRDKYFPIVYHDTNKKRVEIVAALKKAGYIK